MSRLRVLLVSEYPAQSGAPTGALASDLESYLTMRKKVSVRFIKVSRPYVPGGLSWSRIRNLLHLHTCIWFIFPYELLLSILSNTRICVIATTSPPLIQWTCTILGSIFRLPVIVWYQDAHPEIEARALEERNWPRIARILRSVDRKIAQKVTGFVTLDEAMRITFLDSTKFTKKSSVIPPWSTYLEPAKTLRAPDCYQSPIRLIYAGNYGKVHDLTPLAAAVQTLRKEEKKRLSITFVGMGDEGRLKLQQLFLQTGLSLEFKPRLATVGQLASEFEHYDFGIVSLADDRVGVACPSKALTYLSQGLPIFYVGPAHTLPWQLCQEGWGVILSEVFKDGHFVLPDRIVQHVGRIFPNPKEQSQERFYDFIMASERS